MSNSKIVRRFGIALVVSTLATIGLTAGAAQAADYKYAITPGGAHVPCGLTETGPFGPHNDGMYTWHATVGNCHTYGVRRKIVYTYLPGFTGDCVYYPAHRAYTTVATRSASHIASC